MPTKALKLSYYFLMFNPSQINYVYDTKKLL